MEKRRYELTQLQCYSQGIDKELTMILQSLQWDRNDFMKGTPMVICKHDKNHRIPSNKQEDHEKACNLKCQGYAEDDMFLPDPLDVNANTLVILSKYEISKLIQNASKSDPSFRKRVGSPGAAPLSLARLQRTYSADERRAIHDAVVRAVPLCHDLTELTLLSSKDDEDKGAKNKSRVEILAELRDMRRRRAKYRVAAKSRNYSDVLRDVIKTQMECYADVQSDANSTATSKQNTEVNTQTDNAEHIQLDNDRQRHVDKHDRKRVDNIRTGSMERQELTNRRSEYKSVDSKRTDRDRNYSKRNSMYDVYGNRERNYSCVANDFDGSSGSKEKERYHKNRDKRCDLRQKYYEEEGQGNSFRGSSQNENSYRSTHRSDSIKRDDRSKYDKCNSERKRYHKQRSNSSYRDYENEGDRSHREERHKRYYVTESDYDCKEKKTKK